MGQWSFYALYDEGLRSLASVHSYLVILPRQMPARTSGYLNDYCSSLWYLTFLLIVILFHSLLFSFLLLFTFLKIRQLKSIIFQY